MSKSPITTDILTAKDKPLIQVMLVKPTYLLERKEDMKKVVIFKPSISDGGTMTTTDTKKLDYKIDWIGAETPDSQVTILVIKCGSGYGRAPTILAYLLVVHYGYDPMDAVDYVRVLRPGAINTKQLTWILKLSPKKTAISCPIL